VGIVLFNLVLPRVGPHRGLLIAHLLVALGLLSLWRGTGMLWFGLGYLLTGALRTTRLLLVAQVDTYLPRAHIGLAYGVLETVASLMLVVGAPIAGRLYAVSPDLPFRAGLVLVAASLLVQARGLPVSAAVGEARRKR
jgi:hypothetical protein